MSIAMFNAISGLTNYQKALDVVSNNIANMSTPGFKRSFISFKEMVYHTLQGASQPSANLGGTNPVQLGLGATIGSIGTQYTQGTLETTGRATDLAITGDGFFMLGAGNDRFYTRNGSFSIDVNGNLVSSNGYYVQGWAASNGEVNSTGEPANLKIPIGSDSIAKPTTKVSFSGNLDASQDVYNAGPPATGGIYTAESEVYDSLGRAHTMSITYQKVAGPSSTESQWDWTATIDGTAAGTGSLVYDDQGNFDAAQSTANPTLTFSPGDGAEDMSVALDFSTSTQKATKGEYSLIASGQDGFKAGSLESFTVDQTGKIIGSYSNGMTQTIGQVALASFVNPEGLEKGDSGILRATANSGAPQIGTAGTGARGTMNSGTLEMSNVDLSTEFTRMIIAQRAFQANSKVISVMDEVMQEMANLKR
ncbi:MAG: flagellar basal-body rod protein FlgF [Firmicutes bacterium]|nr:flagellar basal-body rod protein FlgF [Bacillota bacterium]